MLQRKCWEACDWSGSFESGNVHIELLSAKTRSIVVDVLASQPEDWIPVAILTISGRVQLEDTILALLLAEDEGAWLEKSP